MTRFARSQGSKASNRREPEESTPWSVMRSQLQASQGAGVEDDIEYDEEEDDDGAEEAVKDKGDESDEDAEPDDEEAEDDKNQDWLSGQLQEDVNNEDRGDNLAGNLGKRKIELVTSEGPAKKKKKKKPKAEKCKVCGEKGHRKMDCDKLPEERRKELKELYTLKTERKGCGTGRKKKKQKQTDKLPYEDDVQNHSENTSPAKGEMAGSKVKATINRPGKFVSKKEARDRSGAVVNRPGKFVTKEVRDRSGAVVEEGEALFQGFRVTKQDQKRLQALYRELKEKGLSKVELDESMKRERRIAEKKLARSKKLVCFKCRQPGHQLADCPQNRDNEQTDLPPAAGLCFKCGSLEHTSKDCKSQLKREQAYRYAVCFICKESGHLAKACPDNPRGLYPKGGGCIFCGSVEHLKRDCQRKVEKDLRAGIKVRTLGPGDLEDEPALQSDKHFKKKNKKDKSKQSPKVVAF